MNPHPVNRIADLLDDIFNFVIDITDPIYWILRNMGGELAVLGFGLIAAGIGTAMAGYAPGIYGSVSPNGTFRGSFRDGKAGSASFFLRLIGLCISMYGGILLLLAAFRFIFPRF